MPRTRPFAELAAEVEADPVRRARMETCKRAMVDAFAVAELRAQLGITEFNTLPIEHEEDLYLSSLHGKVTLVPVEG